MCRHAAVRKGERASAETEAKPSRLPYRAIAALALCNAAHFYSLCSIFSYAAFLCVDAGWVEHIDEAGYMAGLLPTAVMSGREPPERRLGKRGYLKRSFSQRRLESGSSHNTPYFEPRS